MRKTLTLLNSRLAFLKDVIYSSCRFSYVLKYITNKFKSSELFEVLKKLLLWMHERIMFPLNFSRPPNQSSSS